MESFKQYCITEGLFGPSLPPDLKRYYNMMTPQARAELKALRYARQIPLEQALRIYISEEPSRNQWRTYQGMVPPERDPGKVTAWGQDSPGWKRF